VEINDLQEKTNRFQQKTDDTNQTDSDIFREQASGQQTLNDRPVFVKLEGGNRRADMEFSSIRESILGPSPSENGSITSGQRMAGDRIANRQMQSPRPSSPDAPDRKKNVPQQRQTPARNRPAAGYNIPENNHANTGQKQSEFQSLKRRIRRNRFRGSYGIGAIGAVLGMLATCIVAIAVVSFIPRLYGLSCVLLPVWEVSGYLLFNGRREKSPVPVIIIFLVSFAGVILIGLGSDIMTPVISQGKTFARTWQTFKGNTGDLHYWGTTLYHALIPLVFVILGMAMTVPKLLKRPARRKRRTVSTT